MKAVRGVSYEVMPGEFLGIVGESGSGKSVSSMAVMGLLPSTARIGGSIKYRGRSLLDMDDHAMSELRGSEIAMVSKTRYRRSPRSTRSASRSQKVCSSTIQRCRRMLHTAERSSCCESSAYRGPNVGSGHTPTSSPVACVSEP